MTPGQSRLRRERAAERRRRRRQIALGLLAFAVIAIAIAALAGSGSGGHGRRGPRAPASTQANAVEAPPRSPDGFLLSSPALKLTGIATPAADPIRLQFRHPPRAGLLFNLQTGQVLWQRNAYKRLPIASLTKMMTALVTVRAAPPADHVLVTKAAVDSNGSKVGVLPLHKYVRLESMLYGLLLPSGNDAAVALAQHVAGSVRVVHTYSAVLPFPIKGGKLYLYNNNPLLIYHYPGATGLKTGFTDAAGRCLVATAERGGVKLGVVLLNSNAPGVESKQLLDRAFHDVYHLPAVAEPPMPAGA